MKYLRAGFAALIFIYMGAGIVHKAMSENSLVDENGARSLIVEDSATSEAIIRIKGDSTTGALLVSGLSTAGCDTREIKKYAIPATSESGTNLFGTATSTAALVVNESTNDVYFAELATAAAATGMLMGPRDSLSIGGSGIRQLHVYNAGSSTSTVSIMYCY